MVQENSIALLRSRLSALVEQEASLLAQAFELSRNTGDRPGVDALFARVQAIQAQRSSLRKELGTVLGTHRMHSASEVWRPGVYEYRQEVGGDSVRVRITQGPIGLQVLLPGAREPVSIDRLTGSFDGPLAVDEHPVHSRQESDAARAPSLAPEADKAQTRSRASRKKRI